MTFSIGQTSPYHDLITELDIYRISMGFHRAFTKDVTCQQKTVTPPDTCSRPIYELYVFYLLRTILFPKIFTDLNSLWYFINFASNYIYQYHLLCSVLSVQYIHIPCCAIYYLYYICILLAVQFSFSIICSILLVFYTFLTCSAICNQ